MSANKVEANVHPDAPVHKGPHSKIPHPPPEDHPHRDPMVHKPIPDTGWRGEPSIPSQEGGAYEKDFLNKPPYVWKSEGDLFKPKYRAQCWCGNISFEFHGDPLDAKHCHCRQCQRLHGAPFQWAVIFAKTSVRMIRNKEDSLHFFSTENLTGMHSVPCKVSCNVPLDFQPTAHIFYNQRVMEVPDGVPKWAGHKGESELLQELTEEEGVLPKYKGNRDKGQIDNPSTA